MRDALHIAILGDLHGHFTLAYRVLERWERETGATLDLILQVGDLGAFPPPFKLDPATLRFAEHDPDELGFAQYYEGSPEADEILGPDAPPERRIEADMVFIRGNHEDFEFLASIPVEDEPVAVDCHGKIGYLAGGARFTFARGSHAITMGALGGISDDGRPGADSVSPYYTANEVRRLRNGGPVDVLLSHEPAAGSAAGIHPKYAGAGSPEVLALVRDLKPRFHFCGHYHEAGQPLEVPGETRSYMLNAVNFLRPHRLNPGCIGILRWAERAPLGFEILDAPWVREFTRATFRYL